MYFSAICSQTLSFSPLRERERGLADWLYIICFLTYWNAMTTTRHLLVHVTQVYFTFAITD
jgi:hypothetical protein